MAEQRISKNVVLFPFMAQSHIIAFLALAQRIQQKGYSITFLNTPLNITNLKKSPASSSITFLDLPFNSSDHGLPPAVESIDNLPPNLFGQFGQATVSLSIPFRKLLSHLIKDGRKPVCIISDMFLYWISDVAHEFGIFQAIFSASGGFGLACYYSMWLDPPHVRTAEAVDDRFSMSDFPEAGEINIDQLTPALLRAGEHDSGTNFRQKALSAWPNSDGLLLNTMEDLDGLGLMYFRRKLNIPVWGIGPLLLPEEYRAKPVGESAATADECIRWLDMKEENSVIYICFGSQKANALSASQMMNLAIALQSSRGDFIWVVRPPVEYDVNKIKDFVAEEWLPAGFVQRVRDENRGLIVTKWAPQMEILAHKSVAAFINHCGWISVLESLTNGVPVMGWPTGADNFFNSKLLTEEVGVCVEFVRGAVSDDVMVRDILEKTELVMSHGNEKGREIRRKANEVKESIRDALRDDENYKGSSVKALDEFFAAANSTHINNFS